MTTPKHTPGPWNYGQVKENPIFDIIGPDLTGRGKEVVGTFRATQSRVENLANAHLIAAAPDMLDALQAIVDAFGDQNSLLIDQCKAALNKAIGKQ